MDGQKYRAEDTRTVSAKSESQSSWNVLDSTAYYETATSRPSVDDAFGCLRGLTLANSNSVSKNGALRAYWGLTYLD